MRHSADLGFLSTDCTQNAQKGTQWQKEYHSNRTNGPTPKGTSHNFSKLSIPCEQPKAPSQP